MALTPNGSPNSFEDICRCIYDWYDHDLEELEDDQFDAAPCATCGGRVVTEMPPVWMTEEEEDC